VLDRFSPGAAADLIGGSWGAVLGAATAARHPARVRRMLLGSFRTSANRVLLEMARAGRRYVEAGQPERVADIFVEGFGARLPQAKKDQIRRQMRALPAEQARHLHALSLLFADGADISRHVDLGAVRARTLILNGAEDPIVDEENLHWAVARIPDCAGYLVPEVGHFLHEECPALLETYAAFFRGARFLPIPGQGTREERPAELPALTPAWT
jgi:pimeloyl-ACP methyl ester carboxylesterase